MHFIRSSDAEKGSWLRSESGRGLMEFALASPVLFLVLFGIIEVVRYQTAAYLLQKATLSGLRIATTVDGMQLDIRNETSSSPTYNRYSWGHEQSVTEAENFAKNTWFADSGQSGNFTLKEFELPTGVRTNVLVLRPGEHGFVVEDDNSLTRVDNPGSCASDHPDPSTCSRVLADSEDWEQATLNDPYLIMMMASVKPIVTGLPDFTLKATALGYREQVRSGMYPDKPKMRDELKQPEDEPEPTECASPAVACEAGDVPGMQASCEAITSPLHPTCNLEVVNNCCECVYVSGFLANSCSGKIP